MKNIIKHIILLIFFSATVLGANASKFREVTSSVYEDEIPVIYTDEENKDAQKNTLSTVNALQDNNKKLYGIVGKSQVINFDSEIKRVSLTDKNIADVVVLSPKQVIVNGKQTGTTSLIFWGKNSDEPLFYNLVIRQNTDAFIQAVQYIAPNENASVIFNDTGAVLTGHISSAAVREQIKSLANAYNIKLTDMTESPSKQVLLEVKVTEASKTFSRNLGVNLIASKDLVLEDLKIGDSWKLNGGGSGSIAQSNGGLTLGYVKSSGKFFVDIEASEAKGDIKILAEPKLLAANGEEGSFSAGNQVPVPSSVGSYGNVAYDYKDTGVLLKFTPTIMEKSGRIRLKLKPEISEVDNSISVAGAYGTAIYGFKTRKLETTVELMDGETLVIAGLMKNTNSRNKDQVPILGNIPIIGNLLATTKSNKEDTERVIFITPKIVDNSISTENL